MNGVTSRQELYDRIRTSSKDEVILEEMIRLGFWPRAGEQPFDSADEIRRRGELERQLRSLTVENRQLHNAEALKKAARKRRLAESRQKRKENKERKLREKQERAEAWQARKQSEILYLGPDVSSGLNDRECNEPKLLGRGLPIIRDAAQLAEAMEISVGELRFLAFFRKTSTTTHYRRFSIPKKTGGVRNISAPMPRLKRAQEWVLFNILERIELHSAAHGFRRGRSIVTNARPHVDRDVVVNVDVKDFFPTITFKRIRGLFRSFGFCDQVATILALICSEPIVDEVRLDNKTYYVARSERFLPQGAPSSPAITNAICRGLDARLAHLANSIGMVYTRYADDLTFSGSGVASADIGRLLRRVKHVVDQEGFELHPDKTRIQRRGRRQEVTGLVVNERVSVPRSTLRRFRATLFQIEKDGPAGKRWGASVNVLESIEGFANFIAMVEPEKGAAYQNKVREIAERYRRPQSPRIQRERWKPKEPASEPISEPADVPKSVVETSTVPTPERPPSQPSPTPPPPKKKPWWKFW